VLRYLRGDFAKARAHFVHVTEAQKQKAARLLEDEAFFRGARS
jgi:hypothetical protein